MTDARRYPLDFDSLDKGGVVSAETITEIFGIPPTSSLYSGKQVELCYRIEREIEARGRDVTVICDHAEIRILTDSEATEYNRTFFRKGLKKVRRAHRKMSQVDAGKLSPEERRTHDRTLVVQGAILAGIETAKQELPFLPYRRNTPGLPAPETANS